MKNLWNEEETRIITRTFPVKGARATKEALQRKGYERSMRAIMQKATRMMLYRDPPEGYVSANSVNGKTGEGYYRTLFYALRDGVLFDRQTDNRRYFVPEEWVIKKFDAFHSRRNAS